MAALGERQFRLALFLREAAGVFPFLVRRFEGVAAVYPDPAVSADPLGAIPDVRVPAGDDHRNVVGILAGNAVLGAGVPQGVLGRELANSLDFQRANRVVVAQTPVPDVAMMADPIEQLAAAGIVVPAPVHVTAGLDVRLHL